MAVGDGMLTARALQECYRRVTYKANGETLTVKDANGNRRTYVYDDWRRLTTTTFPRWLSIPMRS